MNKTGKSISQFTHQYSLTGDELLLVNKHLDGNQYESKSVTLSTLVDYISERLDGILEESNLITEDGIDIALCDGNDTLIAYN